MSEVSGAVAEPLLLLGETRRSLLRAALSACMDSWRQRWFTTRDPIHVTLAEGDEPAGERTPAGWPAVVATSASKGAVLHLRAAPEAFAALMGTGSGVDAGSIDLARGIGGELQQEVLRSLCLDITKAAGLGDVEVEHKASSSPVNRAALLRDASVTVTFGTTRARINLLISPRLIDLLAPPRKGQSQTAELTRRRQAITEEPVQVEALLGDVEVSLNELARLAEGDVIVLDQPLASMGYLAMPDGTRIAKIALGSSGVSRAVSLTK